jgi:hypothetical protein
MKDVPPEDISEVGYDKDYPGVEGEIDRLEGLLRRVELSNTELGLENDRLRILKRVADELADAVQMGVGYVIIAKKYRALRDG